MLRVGLVGCGVIGRLHAQRLSQDPRVRLTVLCDADAKAAEALQKDLAPQAVLETDARRAIAQPDLDAVVLCSPTTLHYEQCCWALDRALHVLCEKPLATERRQIIDLAERSQQAERLLSVAYQRRYKSAYATARRELTEHAAVYGPLQQIHIFVCERWQQTIAGTWRDDPAVGAGYFGDAGSHQIDVALFISGQQPLRVLAQSDPCGSRVEIVTQAWAELSGGARLVVNFIGNANHWHEDIHFHCRDADLLLRSETFNNTTLSRCRNNQIEPITALLPENDPDRAFIDAILAGTSTISPASCALPMFDWTAAVLASARSHQWVDLPRLVGQSNR
jgi:predicted dehydrogenase